MLLGIACLVCLHAAHVYDRDLKPSMAALGGLHPVQLASLSLINGIWLGCTVYKGCGSLQVYAQVHQLLPGAHYSAKARILSLKTPGKRKQERLPGKSRPLPR